MEVLFFIIAALTVSFLSVVFFGAPYVPTLKRDVSDISKIYAFKKSDVFLDVGSGDGVVLRAVAPKVQKAVGYELSPWLLYISRWLSKSYANIDIQYANIWKKPFPQDVTVIYVFFNAKYMRRIATKVQQHADHVGRDIYLISFGFTVNAKEHVKQQGAMHLYRFSPLYKHK